MPAKIVLVTGGARSGKSEFAEKYVLHYGAKCAYIATAEILDEEMAERVRLHKARRPRTRWIKKPPIMRTRFCAKLRRKLM